MNYHSKGGDLMTLFRVQGSAIVEIEKYIEAESAEEAERLFREDDGSSILSAIRMGDWSWAGNRPVAEVAPIDFG